MKYSREGVYSFIRNAIMAEFPNAHCTGKYIAKPAEFPACYIHEIDRNRPRQYTQLDFQDVQWESVFEFQVASARPNTAMSEAYEIMDVARQAFSNLYYREFSETTIDGGDRFTVIGRFRRVIGGADTMPNTD